MPVFMLMIEDVLAVILSFPNLGKTYINELQISDEKQYAWREVLWNENPFSRKERFSLGFLMNIVMKVLCDSL